MISIWYPLRLSAYCDTQKAHEKCQTSFSLLNFIILGYGKHLCSRLHTSVVIVHAGRKSVLKSVEPLFTLDLALTLCVWQLSRWCRNLKHRYKEKHLYNRTRKANATLCRLSWQYDWRTHRTTAANQNDKSVWRLSQLYMNYNTAQRYKCCTDLHNFFVTPLIFFFFFKSAPMCRFFSFLFAILRYMISFRWIYSEGYCDFCCIIIIVRHQTISKRPIQRWLRIDPKLSPASSCIQTCSEIQIYKRPKLLWNTQTFVPTRDTTMEVTWSTPRHFQI